MKEREAPCPGPAAAPTPAGAPGPCTRSPGESGGAEELPLPGSTPPCPADATRRPRSPCGPKGAESGTESRGRWRGRPLPPGGRGPLTPVRATPRPAAPPAQGAPSPPLVQRSAGLPQPRSTSRCFPLGLETPPGSLALRSDFPSSQCPLCPGWNFTPHSPPPACNLAYQLRSLDFSLQKKGAGGQDFKH